MYYFTVVDQMKNCLGIVCHISNMLSSDDLDSFHLKLFSATSSLKKVSHGADFKISILHLLDCVDSERNRDPKSYVQLAILLSRIQELLPVSLSSEIGDIESLFSPVNILSELRLLSDHSVTCVANLVALLLRVRIESKYVTLSTLLPWAILRLAGFE